VHRAHRRSPGVVLLLLALALLGCSAAGEGRSVEDDGHAVRVASFDFVESRLLGELYATALEQEGIPVARRLGLGPREVVGPALEQGLVDVVPEYAGSALRFLSGSTPGAAAEAHAALTAALAPRGLVALPPAPGQDQNGVVVSQATAARLQLRTVSDLRPVAARLTFGGPPECPERPLCLLGLQQRYGLRFSAFVPFESRASTAESLLAGQVDVGMLETVDAYLADGRLVLLRDDKVLQPPENVVPVLRADVLDVHGPRLREALEALSATLTTAALVELDRQVVLNRRPLADVAQEWVSAHRR
jgi:osmoprotectant transport system substrate-binding protein